MFNFLKKKENIVVRIPPSPTGNLHVGTARTALFNYIFAKKNNGKIILRFEDTDLERNKKEYEENILDGLNWLGITYDQVFKQSERINIYKKYLKKMIDQNKAYISKESVGEREEVIRFRNPNKEIIFEDEIRGKISFNTTELGDFVIAKSIDEPLYHLAVVVDDFEMKVTHVIRGEDHISNTPRQILIQEAIGAKRPIYAHLPLILGKNKSKISKRDGATAISQYREMGYLKDALINFLAFLGWNPGTNKEMFSINELINEFSLKQIQKGGATFNEEKLDWYNRKYIKDINDEEFVDMVCQKIPNIKITGEQIAKLAKIIKERINKLEDITEMYKNGEFSYFESVPEYEAINLKWKNTESLEKTKEYLENIISLLEPVDLFIIPNIKNAVWNYAEEIGKGDVLWPFRYALSGKDKSPDPIELSFILGKKETITRLRHAIEKIN